MFPIGLILLIAAVLLFSAAASVFGFIGGGALVFGWVMAFAALFGLLLLLDGHGAVRRTGAGLLAAVALGVALTLGIHPALAQTAGIAPPPGDTGFWGTVNGYIADALGAVVTAAVAWLCAALAAHTKIKIRADQEAQIRETMKTGAFAAAHDLELTIADHWTPAQQQKVVGKMVAWAEQRAAAQLKKLGLPGFVVNAMAQKVLGQVQGMTGDLDLTGSPIGGNPGETAALDRVVGPGGN